MKKIIPIVLLVTTSSFLYAQKIKSIVAVKEVDRIERVLASDNMKGRKVFTPEIDKAADFISSEFKKTGLQTWDNNASFLQSFTMINQKLVSTSATINEEVLKERDIVVITSQPNFEINQDADFERATIKSGGSLFREAIKYLRSSKNYFITVDTAYAKVFPRLTHLMNNSFKSDKSVVFILTEKIPDSFSIKAIYDIEEKKLSNVVAVLPGKSKKDEYVIFSGHYDHIGTGEALNGDSIFNGANDDAAGTTAVIMLAKYFKAFGNNERTIIFAAFTAEEVGGFGSQYFSQQLNPEKVVAMFNIEMIGTESKWGKNSAYITGFEKTNLGEILQKNLKGSGFTFYPDPYPDQQLFYRSDNATLARQGVPAHTISTSKMDGEPNYHQVSDHVETLDIANMAMIIKSIAISATSIVAGADKPLRVNVNELK